MIGLPAGVALGAAAIARRSVGERGLCTVAGVTGLVVAGAALICLVMGLSLPESPGPAPHAAAAQLPPAVAAPPPIDAEPPVVVASVGGPPIEPPSADPTPNQAPVLRPDAEALLAAWRSGTDPSTSFDRERLANRVIADEPALQGGRAAVLPTVNAVVGAQTAELSASIATGGSLTLKKAVPNADGSLHAWVRVLDPSGYDFFELRLERIGGAVAVTDSRALGVGRWWSELLRAELLESLAARRRERENALTEAERLRLELIAAGGQLPPGAQALPPVERLRWIEALPAEARSSYPVWRTRLELAQAVSVAELTRAVDAYAAQFGEGMDTDRLRLAAGALSGDIGAVVKAASRIERVVGPDGFLQSVVAQAWLANGNTAVAREAAQKAIRTEPSLADPWLVLLEVAIHHRQHNDAVAALQGLDRVPGAELPDLAGYPGAEELLASPPYRDWAARREAGLAAAAAQRAARDSMAPTTGDLQPTRTD